MKPKKLYYFDEKGLRFVEWREPRKQKIIRHIKSGVPISLISIVVLFAYFSFFGTPIDNYLKEENKYLRNKVSELQRKIQEVDKLMANIIEMDKNVYSIVLGKSDSTIDKVGFGGDAPHRDIMDISSDNAISKLEESVKLTSKKVFFLYERMRELNKLAKEKAEMFKHIPAIIPLKINSVNQIVSGFGIRKDPIYGVDKEHTGIDIVAAPGTPVYATGDGTVSFAGTNNTGYGLHVIIDHGYGYETLYGHLSSIKVKEGDKVKRGDLIGYVGSTGKSVGPHLHYEVIKNGVKVNPINFFFFDIGPDKYREIVHQTGSSTHSMD